MASGLASGHARHSTATKAINYDISGISIMLYEVSDYIWRDLRVVRMERVNRMAL